MAQIIMAHFLYEVFLELIHESQTSKRHRAPVFPKHHMVLFSLGLFILRLTSYGLSSM